MENRGKSLAKNTAILSFGTLCTKGIMFIMTPLFIRWLSQSDYGKFDLIVTYIALLIPLFTVDCGDAVFRFLVDAKTESDKKSIVTNTIIIDLIAFIIAILLFCIVYIIFKPNISLALSFLLLLIIEAINVFMVMIIRGFKKLPIYAVANILFVLAMTVSVTILVNLCSLGLVGIILGYSIGYLVSSFYMIVKSKVLKYFSWNLFNLTLIKEMLSYSIHLVPTALSWWIMNVSDRTIVSWVLGPASNAILAVSNKIPNLCQTFFGVFSLSWQESASQTINDVDRDKYYCKIMNNTAQMLLSTAAVILSFNFCFFKVLFTSEYLDGYYQVPILIVAIVFSTMSQFFGGIYIAQKESKKNGKTTVLAAIINLIVTVILIEHIGLYAATISTLISYTILIIIRYYDVKKSISIKFNMKTLISFLILIYCFIMSYFNNYVINILNILITICNFFIINKIMIKRLLNQIKRK